MARCRALTVAHLCTAATEGALFTHWDKMEGWGQQEGSAAVVVISLVRLTSVAASAAVSRGTDALAGCRVTGSSVCAVTLQLAGRTVETRRTS